MRVEIVVNKDIEGIPLLVCFMYEEQWSSHCAVEYINDAETFVIPSIQLAINKMFEAYEEYLLNKKE